MIASGDVVLITGASSGIGRATAHLLAERGARLVLASRGQRALDDVTRECRDRGAEVLAVPTDVGDRDVVAALFRAAVDRFGRVDACVQAAAVVAYGRLEDVPPEIFDRVVQTDVIGTANVAREALTIMRARDHGTLVLIGSVLGRIATPYMSSYVAAKAAVEQLARALVLEQRDRSGVHVCLLSLGSVDTPIFRQAANYVGRYGRPPPPVVTPERVAAKVVERLERPRARTTVGVLNPIMVLGYRRLPPVYDFLVGPLMRLAGLSRDRVAPHPGNVLTPTESGETVRG